MYTNIIPEDVILVPKIESEGGVSNIKQITDALGTKKIVMLDHDDLHSSIIKANQPISKFLECFNTLVEYCKNNNIIVSNIRGYAITTVPEHTFALILALRRGIIGYKEDVIKGEWKKADQFCFFNHEIRELHNSTLGIIGEGAIVKE